MAQITYRGVKYNAEQYKACPCRAGSTQKPWLMYRGIKVDRKFASRSFEIMEALQVVGGISIACVAFLFLIVGEVHLLKVSRG